MFMYHKKSRFFFFIPMKIQSHIFYCFWAIISVTFLHLGFISFNNSQLSSCVSPLFKSLLKHSLAISTCHSSNYALIFRPPNIKNSIKQRHACLTLALLLVLCFSPVNEILALGFIIHVFAKLVIQPFVFDRGMFQVSNVFPLIVTITFFSIFSFSPYFIISPLLLILVTEFSFQEEIICVSIQLAIELSMFLMHGNTKFFPILVLLVALVTSSVFELECLTSNKRFNRVLPLTSQEAKETISTKKRELKETIDRMKKKNWWKFVKFAGGLGGTVLFQNFFRLKTFDDVKAFLYLAVSWVANLTLVRAYDDLGILNFLLGNVIVGCTVSEFGIGRTTWIAYGACLVLFGVRLKLRSLIFKYDGKGMKVVLYSTTKIS